MDSEMKLLLEVVAGGFLLICGVIPLVFHGMACRHKRIVRCPETGGLAEMELSASQDDSSPPAGGPQRKVKNCSLWPSLKECGEGCLK